MNHLTLDHIGVAVKDIERSSLNYHNLLDTKVIHREKIHSQGVMVCFLRHGSETIELLEPLHASSPVAKFIAKRGEGIHHIAFRTPDIEVEMARLRNAGFEILQEHPVQGALNKKIFFIHPRSIGGTLVEICQPAY